MFISILCLSITHGIASVLEVCLICRPLATQWNPNVDGLCGNQIASFAAIEISGLVLDTIIMVSPIPIMVRLRMELKRKIKAIITLDAGAM
jgi:hypothetical protein